VVIAAKKGELFPYGLLAVRSPFFLHARHPAPFLPPLFTLKWVVPPLYPTSFEKVNAPAKAIFCYLKHF